MDLTQRLERVYAAIGETMTREPEKLQPSITREPGVIRISFDGGLSPAQLENAAMQAVFHVAHLRDHLRGWAKAHNHKPSLVDDAVDQSLALKVVLDLANRDKHGGSPRNGGFSGLFPKLTDVRRCVRLTGGSEPPAIDFPLSASGKYTPGIHGDAAAIISGDVLDKNGKQIGDLNQFLLEGLSVFERLLESWMSKNAAPA
jgi:hypothetical protein